MIFMNKKALLLSEKGFHSFKEISLHGEEEIHCRGDALLFYIECYIV